MEVMILLLILLSFHLNKLKIEPLLLNIYENFGKLLLESSLLKRCVVFRKSKHMMASSFRMTGLIHEISCLIPILLKEEMIYAFVKCASLQNQKAISK